MVVLSDSEYEGDHLKKITDGPFESLLLGISTPQQESGLPSIVGILFGQQTN